MSYVIAEPTLMAAAATDLAAIDSTLSAAHSAAARATVAVPPAAADEVSAGIAQLFSEHARGFQALAGRASVSHEQFVQNLRKAATSYTSAEDAIASLLRGLNAQALSVDATDGGGFLYTPLGSWLAVAFLFLVLPLLAIAISPFVAVFLTAETLIQWIITQLGSLLP